MNRNTDKMETPLGIRFDGTTGKSDGEAEASFELFYDPSTHVL